jgi:copper transport protein
VPARVLAMLPAALALLAAAAPGAGAHAALLGATPAPAARVQAPPAAVTLRFTEPLNPRLSGARLLAASGGRKVHARTAVSGRTLVVHPATTLTRGAYRVEWHTVSTDDAHELEGSFGFGLRARPGGTAVATEQSPLAGAGWARALVRALFYAALLAFVGTLLLAAALGAGWLVPPVLEEGGLDLRAARRRERGLTTDLGLFAAALGAATAAVESAHAARAVSPQALRDFLLANPAGLARVAVVALVGLAVALSTRRPGLAALAGVGALGAVVASGHADSADPRVAAVAADWVHLVAAAVWVGGIALIALVWGPGLRGRDREARTSVARHVLAPFGTVALPAFVVVAVAGTVNAAIELGRVSALWETGYGAVLLAKIVLVAALALASYLHALRLRPRLLGANPHPPTRVERRHWLLVRSEPLLALAVVGAVGLLVAFPLPPRQLDAAAEARRSASVCDACPLPAPARDELAVAGQGGATVVAAWIRRGPAGLSGTVRLLDYRGRPSGASARIAGARQAACGRGCETFSLAAAPDALRVSVRERRRTAIATLPSAWRVGGGPRARALLERAQRTMRRLRSVRQVEDVTSGPGTFARTRYTLRAPDRLAYVTGAGVRAVAIGSRQWFRTAARPWQESEAPGGAPFRTSAFFRWTPYATAIQLLGERRRGRRAVAEVALMDPGTPVWTRLAIDVGSGRVLDEQFVARSRFVMHRNFDFNAAVSITPPPTAIRGG